MINLQYRNNTRGLSKLEMISIVVIAMVILGGIASWFSSHRLKNKTIEAQTNLQMIFDQEAAYYKQSRSPISTPAKPSNKHFLPLSSEPRLPGATEQMGNFTRGDWALLNISIDHPVYYSYSVETKGEGLSSSFTAIAKGDLDGDGHFSRWEIRGWLNANEQVQGRDQIYALDPLE